MSDVAKKTLADLFKACMGPAIDALIDGRPSSEVSVLWDAGLKAISDVGATLKKDDDADL